MALRHAIMVRIAWCMLFFCWYVVFNPSWCSCCRDRKHKGQLVIKVSRWYSQSFPQETTKGGGTAAPPASPSAALQRPAARHTGPIRRPGSSIPSPAGGWRAGIRGRAGCASCCDSTPARDCPGAAATGGPAPSSGWPAGCSRCQKWRLGRQRAGGAQPQTL